MMTAAVLGAVEALGVRPANAFCATVIYNNSIKR